MIDDVITHGTWCHLCKNTPWLRLSRIFAVMQNARRRCCWHCNIWPITLLLISKLHTGVCQETFNVNFKIVQTMQNIWNFIVGKSSLKEMANFQRLSRRIHTLIWRPGDMVQNLESPGLSGRVDSTVCGPNKWSSGPLRPVSNVVLLPCWTQLLVFNVTPFKLDQNKNENHATDQVQNLGSERM